MKTALVSGANKGIGYFIAKGLLKSTSPTFRVILACRNNELAAKAAAQLAAETNVDPARIATIPLDLERPDTIKAAAAQLKEQSTTLDVLVNNAGFAFTHDAKEPFSQQAAFTCKINYTGTLAVCDALFPLLNQQTGRVINVSSRAGLLNKIKDHKLRAALTDEKLTMPQLTAIVDTFVQSAGQQSQDDNPICSTAYGFSKVAVSAMTRIHAQEESAAKSGADGMIAHVATCPGWCKSDMAGWDEPPRTAEEGADVMVWLAGLSDAEFKAKNGLFFAERKRVSFENGEEI